MAPRKTIDHFVRAYCWTKFLATRLASLVVWIGRLDKKLFLHFYTTAYAAIQRIDQFRWACISHPGRLAYSTEKTSASVTKAA